MQHHFLMMGGRAIGLIAPLLVASSTMSFIMPAANQRAVTPMSMSTSSSFGSFPEEFNPNYESDSSESGSEFSGRYRTDQYNGSDGAFPLPDESEIPEIRQLRWEREALAQSKFVSGDDVFELRQKISDLRVRLLDARENLAEEGQQRRINELERQLFSLNTKDPEFMYAMSLELMENAQQAGDLETVEKYKIQAKEARQVIPQLNMHGLWVGKYGEHGYEMVNITYSGDTLIATKVTGDQNVPRGETTFTVDLSPNTYSERGSPTSMMSLEPIELNARAARQWGKKFLPRFPGKGQVAAEGFTNAKWLEGQLIMVGRFFSFAWVPIGHQVFFGRPSSELILKMLRDQRDDELKRDQTLVMREAAQNMLEETYWVEQEKSSEYGCFE